MHKKLACNAAGVNSVFNVELTNAAGVSNALHKNELVNAAGSAIKVKVTRCDIAHNENSE